MKRMQIDRVLGRFGFLLVVALAITTVAVLGVRGQTSRVPPREFDKGMVDQPKAKVQSRTLAFADGRVNRVPPKGTVPWGAIPFAVDSVRAEDDRTAYELKRMPYVISEEFVAHGRTIYGRYCALCHGAVGDGQGITTQFGMNQPPTYHSDALRTMTDGAIYKVITEGKGTMGPLAGRLTPEDRWAAVAWVRVLQHARNVPLARIPEAERKKLEEME